MLAATSQSAKMASGMQHGGIAKQSTQKVAIFQGLKACGKVSTSRAVLEARSRPVMVRAGRIAAVTECKKVAVLGAGGGIGQPLSLLLKMNRLVSELAIYDIANVKGVAADLSHCNTPVKVIKKSCFIIPCKISDTNL